MKLLSMAIHAAVFGWLSQTPHMMRIDCDPFADVNSLPNSRALKYARDFLDDYRDDADAGGVVVWAISVIVAYACAKLTYSSLVSALITAGYIAIAILFAIISSRNTAASTEVYKEDYDIFSLSEWKQYDAVEKRLYAYKQRVYSYINMRKSEANIRCFQVIGVILIYTFA